MGMYVIASGCDHCHLHDAKHPVKVITAVQPIQVYKYYDTSMLKYFPSVSGRECGAKPCFVTAF